MTSAPSGAGGGAIVDATYLVECFWPGVTREGVEAAAARARARAAVLRRGGSSLRFLGSLLIPADEVVFFQFAASSSDEVVRVSREAALPFDRVAASLWLKPGRRAVP
jgi:hypothetical protein